LNVISYTILNQWCNCWHLRLECCISWVRDPIGSNLRLWYWYLLLLC